MAPMRAPVAKEMLPKAASSLDVKIETASVDTRNADLRSENDRLRTALESQVPADEAFGTQVLPELLPDTIGERPVLLIAVRGIDEDVVRALQTSIRDAGGAPLGIVWLDARVDLDHELRIEGRVLVHAAACVDLGDGRLGALAQVGAKTGQRAAERGRAADGERLATDAALLGKGIAHKGGCRKGSGGVRDKLATLHGKGSGYKGGCGVARVGTPALRPLAAGGVRHTGKPWILMTFT